MAIAIGKAPDVGCSLVVNIESGGDESLSH